MPKRLNNLWPRVVGFENLLSAYRKARLGKQQKNAVAEFSLNLESELIMLQQQLMDGSYQPGGYRLFTIYERKPRSIAAAPFRDRVIHHALLNIVEPLIDKRFIDDSHACRKNKGVHKAVNRYQNWAKRYLIIKILQLNIKSPSFRQGCRNPGHGRYLDVTQMPDLSSILTHRLPSLDAGYRHPCRYDDILDIG